MKNNIEVHNTTRKMDNDSYNLNTSPVAMMILFSLIYMIQDIVIPLILNKLTF